MSEKPSIPAEPAHSILVRHRLFLVVFSHALLFASALLAAFSVAYNFRWAKLPSGVYPWFFELFVPLLVLALPIKLLVFQWRHQYRCSWRYVGWRDLFGVMSASFIGSFLFLTAFFLLENGWLFAFGNRLFDHGPVPVLRQSAVFSLDWAATVVFVSVAKILVRFYYEDVQPRSGSDQRRVLIVGAGNTGEAVLRELLRLGSERYHCVGFLSDAPADLYGRIHDAEVLGRTDEIRAICKKQDVQEVLIALPDATPKTIRALVQRCEGTGVLFRTMPAVRDVIEGRVQVSSIRNIDIADLLGRDPVQLDVEQIGRVLLGGRVLVSGAGGSIGAEMCRQIAVFKPQRMVLVERAENNLFEIDRELRAKHPDLKIVPYVGDVCDQRRIETIMGQERPSVVYHAAAHKHVPMMQLNPGEAIKNNIGGTAVIANAALSAGVEKMVLISTDKAVNPTSVMGCTKRITELYVQSLSGRGATQFVTVRFGNVLGSSGSVVPIFREQIAAGGPVTVTHPDMVRYFMTIPEAAQLVLQAGAMGKGGEIYVLHMGDPVKIFDLARDMIALSGLRPGMDVEITFSGRRPGEKLFEELASDGEDIGDTAHPKIGIWKHRTEDGDAVQRGIADLIKKADTASVDELQAELKRLVPEYTPDEGSKSAPEQTPHTAESVVRP